MPSTTDAPARKGELAHALRNPLSSVKIALQALERDAPGPRTELALREVRKMERLLAALADSESQAPSEPVEVEVRALVASAAAEVAEELAVRGAEVTVVGGAASLRVSCDVRRLRAPLAQLLLETADRADGERVTVAVKAERGAGGKTRLSLAAPGLTQSGTARTCLAALSALVGPGGGRVDTRGEDTLCVVLPR